MQAMEQRKFLFAKYTAYIKNTIDNPVINRSAKNAAIFDVIIQWH